MKKVRTIRRQQNKFDDVQRGIGRYALEERLALQEKMRELARVKSEQYIQKMKRQGYDVAEEEVAAFVAGIVEAGSSYVEQSLQAKKPNTHRGHTSKPASSAAKHTTKDDGNNN